MPVKHLYLLSVAALMGCAAGGTSASSASSSYPAVPSRRSNVLTWDEITAAHADAETAYDAVSRLRPNWLTPHGVTSTIASGAGTEYATVFIDGQAYGDLQSLKTIPAYHVGEYRYYNITEAGGKFGIRAGSSGVIELSMNFQSKPE